MSLFSQECDYKNYNQIIGLARKEYKAGNFKEAQEIFKEAFSKTDFPLGLDLSFALATANKIKDDSWAIEIASKLAKGGIPLRYFNQFKSHKWFDKFKEEFNAYAKFYKDNFNIEMKEAFKKLKQDDKGNNEKYHRWRTKEIEMTLNELIEGAKKISNDFKQFIEDYGFPTEKKMGYNYIYRLNRIERYNFEVLITHIFQRGEYLFKSEIDTMICQGVLLPNFKEILRTTSGYSNGKGIEQEMIARFKKFRGIEKTDKDSKN